MKHRNLVWSDLTWMSCLELSGRLRVAVVAPPCARDSQRLRMALCCCKDICDSSVRWCVSLVFLQVCYMQKGVKSLLSKTFLQSSVIRLQVRVGVELKWNRAPTGDLQRTPPSFSAFENECNLWPLKTSVHLCIQKSKTLQVSILKRKAVPQPHKYKLGQVTDICRLYQLFGEISQITDD